MGILAILTDIEGTTSSIEFVHNTLFPYASRALPDFIRKHGDAHKELLDAVRDEAGEKDADQGRVIEIL
ncbi:MAG: acireductone synthase, partial [Myxococcota bacterium]